MSLRKSDNLRERRNKPKIIDITAIQKANYPKPPPRLLKKTKDWWDDYWNSDLATYTNQDTDLAAVSRLATLMDERERCYRQVKKEGRMISGSQGQMVLNPLYRHIQTLDQEIRQIEDRFGLSPKSRAILGITFGSATQTIADLNAKFENSLDDQSWYPEEEE